MAPVVSIFCICDALILSIYDIYTTKILSLFYSTYVLAILPFWRATLKIKGRITANKQRAIYIYDKSWVPVRSFCDWILYKTLYNLLLVQLRNLDGLFGVP
ncbi:MAG: hypothetical protein Ct9H300mP2_0700 [Candidatus Neomarinimicrobiota bacterium]|nr:MAG: hypothetical protein Ct9H300mP2_0700 [Candidatus Neomarinimicrobiota bacterium]